MKKLLALFIITFAAVCNAAAPPAHKEYHPILFGPYDTITEAATYALQKSYNLSNHYEFGGRILKNTKDGKFYFTLPRTDLGDDHVYTTEDDVYPNNPELQAVGDYHTHPCMPYTHIPLEFSPNDVLVYEFYNKQGYMANFCNGNIIHWDPTDIDDAGRLDGLGPYGVDENTTYEGEIVGKIALNKTPDIQESVLDGLRYWMQLQDEADKQNAHVQTAPTRVKHKKTKR